MRNLSFSQESGLLYVHQRTGNGHLRHGRGAALHGIDALGLFISGHWLCHTISHVVGVNQSPVVKGGWHATKRQNVTLHFVKLELV